MQLNELYEMLPIGEMGIEVVALAGVFFVIVASIKSYTSYITEEQYANIAGFSSFLAVVFSGSFLLFFTTLVVGWGVDAGFVRYSKPPSERRNLRDSVTGTVTSFWGLLKFFGLLVSLVFWGIVWILGKTLVTIANAFLWVIELVEESWADRVLCKMEHIAGVDHTEYEDAWCPYCNEDTKVSTSTEEIP